jgi:isochorismate synthase
MYNEMIRRLSTCEGSLALFLASPRHTLLAQGTRAVLEIEGGEGQWGRLPDRVRSAFQDISTGDDGHPALVVGALPFFEDLPAHLVFPEHVRWDASTNGVPAPVAAPTSLTALETRHVPDKAIYMDAVRKAIARIRSTDLKKVVLARSLELTAPSRIDLATLLGTLLRRNTGAYTFALDVAPSRYDCRRRGEPAPRRRRVLFGASPELLVSRSKLQVAANPLAGSSPRSAEPVEDQYRAGALLASQKDRREHAFVVEAVVEALRPLCTDLRVPKEPSLLGTATMWHLSTEIYGRLRNPSTCALQLATALHPTPAVCGTPRAEAMRAIRELEGLDRGFYAGLVGWSDATGDGEWVVTIRCGEVEDRNVRLFAGAGIIDGSRPEDEFIETSAKLSTVLSALGLVA